MYIFDEVVAVGFNTLRYDASVGVLNPPHESTTHIFEEGLCSAAKMARLKNTSSLLCANLQMICARSAHECNSLQN